MKIDKKKIIEPTSTSCSSSSPSKKSEGVNEGSKSKTTLTDFLDRRDVYPVKNWDVIDSNLLAFKRRTEFLDISSPELTARFRAAAESIFRDYGPSSTKRLISYLGGIRNDIDIEDFFGYPHANKSICYHTVKCIFQASVEDQCLFFDLHGRNFIGNMITLETPDLFRELYRSVPKSIEKVIQREYPYVFCLSCRNLPFIDMTFPHIPQDVYPRLPTLNRGLPFIELLEAEKSEIVGSILASMSREQLKSMMCHVGNFALQWRRHPSMRPIIEAALHKSGFRGAFSKRGFKFGVQRLM